MSYYNTRQSSPHNHHDSYVRFLNAIPNAPALDIYMNDNIISKGLEYSEFTDFEVQVSDTYLVEAYFHNTKSSPVLSVKVYLFENTYYTIPLIGTMQSPNLELIADRPSLEKTKHNLSYIRFVNLSPNSNSCDISIDTIPIFYHLYFMEVSNYLPIALQEFTISAMVDDETINLSDFKLEHEKYYTIYILGFSKGLKPGISIKVLKEGRGSINFS